MAAMADKQVIGRRAIVSLPELGLYDIQAKIDTGAYTSALHAKDIKVIESKKRRLLSFKPLDQHQHSIKAEPVEIADFQEVIIKNSFGHWQKRYVVTTTIVIGGTELVTDITLADRQSMKLPVLLGRKVLKDNFLVDVSIGIE